MEKTRSIEGSKEEEFKKKIDILARINHHGYISFDATIHDADDVRSTDKLFKLINVLRQYQSLMIQKMKAIKEQQKKKQKLKIVKK